MKKKKLFILILTSVIGLNSLAQSENYIPKFTNTPPSISNSIIYQNNNKIGVNVVNPGAVMDIKNNSTSFPVLRLRGIGSSKNYGESSMDFIVESPTTTSEVSVAQISGYSSFYAVPQTRALYFYVSNTTTNILERKMAIFDSGDVIIGSNFTYSNYRLSVNSSSNTSIAQFCNNLNGAIIQILGLEDRGVIRNGSFDKGLEFTTLKSGGTSNDYQLYLAHTGEVGIGTNVPNGKLHIKSVSGQNPLRVQISGSTKFLVNSNGGVSIGSTSTPPQNGLYVNGSVGIGTTTVHNYKLAVAGKIITEELVVKLLANWPDYVFEESYDLKSLDEVEQYINEHKHLPNVPSAREVEENGIGIGEMNAILLQKIEELTLHAIKQQKMIEELQKEVNKNN